MSSILPAKISIKPPFRSHSSSSSTGASIAKSKFIWRFPPSKFDHLPSCTPERLSPLDVQPLHGDEELSQRQELALLIYELGSLLHVSFTCVYTGVVYMHRFFMLHSFQQCVKEIVAAACLFLACKVNEIPRPLNEFTRCLCQLLNHRSHSTNGQTSPSSTIIPSEMLCTYNQQIIDYENMLLSTLGFCLNVDQPYMTITRTSQSLSLPIEVSQQAYEIATKSIFFTLFPMKYTTNCIACFALHSAIQSSQIHVPDNTDGSQWFHSLNEEFTEKLLQELIDEYQLICTAKCSRDFQDRFEQLRQQRKAPSVQSKPKLNGDQPDSHTPLQNGELHPHPIATTSGSVRSCASSSSTSSIPQQQPNCYEHGAVEVHHHTPNRSTLVNPPPNGYSPSVMFQSPKPNTVQFLGSYHSNHSSASVTSAKPIPTLMSSNSYHASLGSRHQARFPATTFRYPCTSPAQRAMYLPPPPPQPQHYHQPYPSYYPQQQTPLFYHPPQDPAGFSNKRYGEPPDPPMKRFRYSLNPPQAHY